MIPPARFLNRLSIVLTSNHTNTGCKTPGVAGRVVVVAAGLVVVRPGRGRRRRPGRGRGDRAGVGDHARHRVVGQVASEIRFTVLTVAFNEWSPAVAVHEL